jgi:hypothetical protein
MLKVFQVNTGTFLDLHEELSPSQRVQDLTSEICRCTKSQLQYVVLMTIDGLLMDRNQIIASYGAGTVSFVVRFDPRYGRVVLYCTAMLSNNA